ncbi:MAG: DUF6580 family putative transport protein [Bacteroidota bacterium]
MSHKQFLVRNGAAFLLVVIAAFSRLLPHPANFTAIAAIALFGGVYLEKRYAFVVPILAMLVSDYFIGFYSGMYWVYGSFVLIGLIGLWLRNHKKPLYVLGGTFASSILFFVVTNFGVWMPPGTMYAPTWGGLIECYVAAIPFFRNTVSGDIFFVAVMFTAYEGVLFALKKVKWTEQSLLR